MNTGLRILIVTNAVAVIVFAAAWTWAMHGGHGTHATEPATVDMHDAGSHALEVAQGGWTDAADTDRSPPY